LKPTRLDYCQFLLSTQINFTNTYYADHSRGFSHDAVNRLLKNSKMTSALIWEHVEGDITPSPHGCIVFDDSVLDKNHSHSIEMVRRQYSGNAHGVIKGIGMVNCLYVNPDSGQYWIVDYRLYDPDGDGKTKLDHVQDMLLGLVASKGLDFNRVLMDSWYATKELMLFIETLGKLYYCPLKSNRLVDDSGGALKYRHVDSLAWSQTELAQGKIIKIRGFPKEYKAKLFRVEVSNNRTDWVVTNDLAQDSLNATQDACGIRWKIEQFHRELKQLTGVEKCQCRKARSQRNHIACAVLVWIRMTAIARKALTNIYSLKKGMLSHYMRQELRSPSVRMAV
jgi:Transposase DDE domain